MNKTFIYSDAPETMTNIKSGENRAPVTTTEQTQTRILLAYDATAAGTKFKLIIFNQCKRALKKFIPPRNVEVVYGTTGTFNSTVLIDYFLQVLDIQLPLFASNGQPLHHMPDYSSCHKSVQFTDALKTCGIEIHMIPLRLTNILQPADVS